MWGITFADLRYRYSQFLIAVVGAGLVLAMALLMSGLAGGFRAETDNTVGGVGAQSWVLSQNAHGSIAGAQFFPQADLTEIGKEPGVTKAAPLVILLQQVLRVGGKTRDVEVFGIQPGDLGDPGASSGRALSGTGQLVVNSSTGISAGTKVTVGAMPLTVVGQVTGKTILAGTPVIYMSLKDAQQLALGGQSLITAVATQGTPKSVPAGLSVASNAEAEQGILDNLAGASSTLSNAKYIMWLVAAVIIGALLYVSALQRVRDFAVIKALGSSSGSLFGSLALQSVIVTLLAAAFAMIVCNFMTGLFKQPIAIPASAFATLPLIAIGVGLIASLGGLRRAVGADPATAFG